MATHGRHWPRCITCGRTFPCTVMLKLTDIQHHAMSTLVCENCGTPMPVPTHHEKEMIPKKVGFLMKKDALVCVSCNEKQSIPIHCGKAMKYKQ